MVLSDEDQQNLSTNPFDDRTYVPSDRPYVYPQKEYF